MKLSMSMLARTLDKYDTERHILRDAPMIRGVRFLSDDRNKYALEYVYIGEASGYFHDQRYRDAMILVCGENQIICHSNDLEMLLNDILSAFDDYTEVEERLAMAASRQAPAAEIVGIASAVIDGPCLVFDLRGKLICGSHLALLPRRIRANLENSGTLGVEMISQVLVDESGAVRHDISDEPQLLHPQGNDGEKAVSMYLTVDDVRVGYMMIFTDSENDARIALHCEKWIGGFLCRAAEFTDSASDYLAPPQVLRQFLEGAQPSQPAIDRLTGETDTLPYMVLMAVRSIGASNPTVYHMLMADMKGMAVRCTACAYRGGVAILAGQRAEEGVLSFFRRRRWLDGASPGRAGDRLRAGAVCGERGNRRRHSPLLGLRAGLPAAPAQREQDVRHAAAPGDFGVGELRPEEPHRPADDAGDVPAAELQPEPDGRGAARTPELPEVPAAPDRGPDRAGPARQRGAAVPPALPADHTAGSD